MSLFSIFPLLAGTLMIIHAVQEEEEAVVEENIEDAMKKNTHPLYSSFKWSEEGRDVYFSYPTPLKF
jgi:hypothetical protein